MAIARPFAYNPGSTGAIPGTEQLGNLAIGTPLVGFVATGLEWWNGPDEELGYVIAYEVPDDSQPTPVPGITGASVEFFRSSSLTEESFVELTNQLLNQNFLTGDQCKTYLNNNGYWTSWGAIPAGMVLYLDTGVAASYPGSGSTWYDLSGYGNNGTINGATYVGGTAAALDFNGTNSDYVDFASVNQIPIGNEPYTISVWFNSDEMPSDRGFIGWGGFGNVNEVNAWRLRNTGVSGFRHYWWGNDLDYTTPMTSGTWYNAIAAYENGSRKLYLNNALVAQDTPTGHNVPYATNLRIGVTADFLNEWFNGKIAQVIIYKRQATTAEINAIWNSGKNRFGYSTPPVNLIMNLDSTLGVSGSSWSDQSGNGNDATMYGGYGTATYNSSQVITLDGTNGYVFPTGGFGTNLDSGFTYEVWAYPTQTSNGTLLAEWSGAPPTGWNDTQMAFVSGTINAGVFPNTFSPDSYLTGPSFSANTWYNIVMTYNDSTGDLKLYVNGTLIGTTNGTKSNPSGTYLTLGRPDTANSYIGGATGYFQGYIGSWKIWDGPLSGISILSNYNSSKSRFGL